MIKRLGLLVVLIYPLPAIGQEQVQLPTTRVTNCTNGPCHANQLDFRFLHGPTAAGACNVCHVYLDETKHTFSLKRTGAQMCEFCHIGKTDVGGLIVHDPVQKGECLSCHNPHGSSISMMLRGASSGETCLSCHDKVIGGKEHVHTPVVEGDCLGCHKAHSSMLPKLLVAQGRSLCLNCHEQVLHIASSLPLPLGEGRGEGSFSSLNSNEVIALAQDHPKPFIHEPVTKDCNQCHNPHASDHSMLLNDTPMQLCISCHEDIAKTASEAIVGHSAVTDDRACLNCHAPHVSNTKGMLKGSTIDVCLDCHNKEVYRKDNSIVASVAELRSSGFHIHEPASQGDCRSCHNPHGAPHQSLLLRPYTGSFYQKYESKAYALCFDCHDEKAITAERTVKATNFRDGDRNLHYVHVKAPAKGGRSCTVCHATHASSSIKQLRASTPFGNWQIPIQFKPNEMGGSCAAGCHRAQTYDRGGPASFDIKATPKRQ